MFGQGTVIWHRHFYAQNPKCHHCASCLSTILSVRQFLVHYLPFRDLLNARQQVVSFFAPPAFGRESIHREKVERVR